MKQNYTITSELKKVSHALVDYIANGYVYRDGEKIPCKVGFTEFNAVVEATHIFVSDGITENGNHYYGVTIEL